MGLALLLGRSIDSLAQTSTPVCRISYAYDVAGNRIKREYLCESGTNPWGHAPWTDHTIFTSLSPNPTTGVVTGVLSSTIGGEAGAAYLTVTTMGGIVVLEQSCQQVTNAITVDITQQIPGQYIFTVAAFNKIESYVITKL